MQLPAENLTMQNPVKLLSKTSNSSFLGPSFLITPNLCSLIRFDMIAMIFLLYDLCITPVAIAWDFPMSGWLLHLDAVDVMLAFP